MIFDRAIVPKKYLQRSLGGLMIAEALQCEKKALTLH